MSRISAFPPTVRPQSPLPKPHVPAASELKNLSTAVPTVKRVHRAAPSQPADVVICQGAFRNGNACTFPAEKGKTYCGHHRTGNRNPATPAKAQTTKPTKKSPGKVSSPTKVVSPVKHNKGKAVEAEPLVRATSPKPAAKGAVVVAKPTAKPAVKPTVEKAKAEKTKPAPAAEKVKVDKVKTKPVAASEKAKAEKTKPAAAAEKVKTAKTKPVGGAPAAAEKVKVAKKTKAAPPVPVSKIPAKASPKASPTKRA